jgi:hypothetical protein
MKQDNIKQSFISRNRFLVMVALAVVIACGMVFASMALYNSSGAAQLDLSRPGYVGVRDKTIDSSSEFKNYPEIGSMNQSAIDDFKNLYDEQAAKIKLADAFKNDPLSPEELGINL